MNPFGKISFESDLRGFGVMETFKHACEDVIKNYDSLVSMYEMSNLCPSAGTLDYEIPMDNIDLSLTGGKLFDGDTFHEVEPNTETVRFSFKIPEENWKIDMVAKTYNLEDEKTP